MSFWAEDPELFLHKGKDGVVHMLRCKKETMTLSSSSMLMKPEDFTDEGTITNHRSLTGGCYDWDKDKYEALIDYIYPKHLMVNCHGSVIGELATNEKDKKATVVLYIRALDILDMGSYGLGPDLPDRAVPARMAKYLQNGRFAQTEPCPREMKLSKEVEALQQELLSSKEKTEVEVGKEMKLTEELAIKSKKVETLKQEREQLPTENIVGIYTKAATDCFLTIQNGQAILGWKGGPGRDLDECQLWMKDDKYSSIVKHRWGFPGYALVNKYTLQALKPNYTSDMVELVDYNPNVLDTSILWTEDEPRDGYSAIKGANGGLYLNAAVKNEVHHGTPVQLSCWSGADNLKWNIVSY